MKPMLNLLHPMIPGMQTIFTSGLPREMISNFVSLFGGFFRVTEDTTRDHHHKRTDPESAEVFEKIVELPQSPVETQTGSDVEEEKPKRRICKEHGDHEYFRCPKRVFCFICKENTLHETIDCPDKAEAYVTLCRICDDGPCENEDDPDHKEEHYEHFMQCTICGAIGEHWEDTCSFDLSDYDSDQFGFDDYV